MIAAGEGLQEMVYALVSHGADVHLRDDNGLSALYLACMGGKSLPPSLPPSLPRCILFFLHLFVPLYLRPSLSASFPCF